MRIAHGRHMGLYGEFSGGITTLTVCNMEVANFYAVMDTLIDQDDRTLVSVKEGACVTSLVFSSQVDYFHVDHFKLLKA